MVIYCTIMKTLVKVMIVAALSGGGFYAYQSANAVELDGDVGTSFSDVRSFRGVKQSDDTVNASVDIGTNLSDQFNVGLGLNSFSTLEEGQTDELRTNLSVGYGITDLLSVSLGYIDYSYQGTADADEVVLGLALETLLNPGLRYYNDSDNDVDTIEVSVGHGLELTDTFGLNLSGVLGNSDEASGDDRTYYSIGGKVVYTGFESVDSFVGVSVFDNDNAGSDLDTSFSIGLSLKF